MRLVDPLPIPVKLSIHRGLLLYEFLVGVGARPETITILRWGSWLGDCVIPFALVNLVELPTASAQKL